MARAGDFSPRTKEDLAHRAGYRCSFPGCSSVTAGPSRESDTATSNTGTACHIFAAADGPGARRVSIALTPAQLSDIENGVWMCRDHGKLIDDDECTYTPQLLKDWRRLAERKAELRQRYGFDADLLKIADANLDPANVAVAIAEVDSVQRQIFEAFLISCLSDSWGKDLANQARELVVELCLNALTHGRARIFSLSITPFSITLKDNGARFGINDLTGHRSGRGGAAVARELSQRFDQIILASSSWENNENLHTLALIRRPGDVSKVTPCSIELQGLTGETSIEKLIEFCRDHPECQRIYVVKPYGTNASELFQISHDVIPHLRDGQDIVLVTRGSSIWLREFAEHVSSRLKVLSIDS